MSEHVCESGELLSRASSPPPSFVSSTVLMGLMRSLKSQYELIESLAAFSFGLIFTLLNFWQDNHLFFKTFKSLKVIFRQFFHGHNQVGFLTLSNQIESEPLCLKIAK